eukprot:5010782-Alexandrium_andersonii.AAC.1
MERFSTGGRAAPPEHSSASPPCASVLHIMSSMHICRWKEKANAFSPSTDCAEKFAPHHLRLISFDS